MLRAGLAALIEAERDMTVVGHAEAAEATLERCRTLRPDVAVIDLLMPGGGLNALKQARAVCPTTRLLAISVLDDIEHVRAAIEGGAQGYLTKRASGRELLSAVRRAMRGETHIGVSVATRAELARARSEPPIATAALTVRETEVLRLLAWGYTHREIAERLSLSKKTVDLYRARISDKLGVRGRAALVRFAVAAGLFGIPSSGD